MEEDMTRRGGLTKGEVITEIAEYLGIPKVAVKDVLELYMDTIASDLVIHGRHRLINEVGTLKVVERAPRSGRNPRTGERVEIPARKAITFTPAKRMKEAVNG
jgi:nucleoid DNA-binding protein